MFARAVFPLTPLLSACAQIPDAGDPRDVATIPVDLPQVPTERFEVGCEPWDEWDKPARPFAILGQSFYVGTCGISAILITGDDGHILIDSGVPEAAPQVLASIRALGFDPRDVEYLLMSHEHFDHVGGHAAIAEATGAQVVASTRAAPVLESGTVAADDPQAGMDHPRFAPVRVDRIVSDGEVLKVGSIQITAHLTPGHSPGAVSWTWQSCSLQGEPPICRRMAYMDSLSPVSEDGYRFTDNREYLVAFRQSIDTVRFLPCDELVTPHPSASGMIMALCEGRSGEASACGRYADELSDRLNERLQSEAQR